MTTTEDRKNSAAGKKVVSVPSAQRHRHFEKPEADNQDEMEKSFDSSGSRRQSSSSEDERSTDDDDFQSSSSSQFSSTESLNHSTKKHHPKSPHQQLKQAEKLAAKFLAKKESCDKAIHELTRAIALTRIVYGDKHWKLAASYVNLAQAYLEKKDYFIQAEYHAERARTLLSSFANNLPDSVTETLNIYSTLLKMHHILAVANIALKKYSISEKDLTRAEKLLDKMTEFSSYRDVDHDLWEIKLTLTSARLNRKQKKHNSSSENYQDVTKLMEKIHGKESPHLIPVYIEWAKLEQSRGKESNHERAIDILQRAHSVASANYKDDDEKLINSALLLARAYNMIETEEAAASAESYMNGCLVSCTNAYGEEHPTTLTVQDELARILIRTNRRQEALKMLRSIVSVKYAMYGDYSVPVAETLTLMAALHLADGELERALKSYEKCLEIRRLMLGEKHPKTIDVQRNIDILRANPAIAGKLKRKEDLKSRPRFTHQKAKS